MQISRQQVSQVVNAYLQQARRAEKGATARSATRAATGDSVTLSKEAQLIQRLVVEVRHLPEVRQERVEALKRQIAQGAFAPTGQAIADQVIGRWLGNHAGDLQV